MKLPVPMSQQLMWYMVVTTMDIIPRRSKNNVFANKVKELSNSITCMNETYHRHASTWMIFSFEIDSQAWENGHIEYLEGRHKRDTKRKKQCGIRQQLFSNDGVHLNKHGKELFVAIITWLKNDIPNQYLQLDVNKSNTYSCMPRAFIKF